MEPIGTHGLACLDDSDYAAYALYMQCQAEAIDATLFAQEAALGSLLSRPSIIVGRFGEVDQIIASGVTVTNFFDNVEYVNNDFMTLSTVGTQTRINIGSPVGSTLNPYLTGMYLVGCSVAMDATGAVTAFSQRTLVLSAADDTIQPPNQQINVAMDINPDAGTTITQVGLNAAFSIVLRGANGVRINHAISHNNAASTVAIRGQSTMWVTYLGPDELVEVA